MASSFRWEHPPEGKLRVPLQHVHHSPRCPGGNVNVFFAKILLSSRGEASERGTERGFGVLKQKMDVRRPLGRADAIFRICRIAIVIFKQR